MSTYCNLINFPQIAKDMLTNDINVKNLDTSNKYGYGSEFIIPSKFPKEFNAWLADIAGLTVEISELFFLWPNQRHPIHIDGSSYPIQKGKLNFIIGGKGSKMCWYEPKDVNKFRIRSINQAEDGGYIHIDGNNARELYSAELVDFCIVDAGTFHTVQNSSELRIAWNLVLADCKTKERLLLPALQERLSEYVVD